MGGNNNPNIKRANFIHYIFKQIVKCDNYFTKTAIIYKQFPGQFSGLKIFEFRVKFILIVFQKNQYIPALLHKQIILPQSTVPAGAGDIYK